MKLKKIDLLDTLITYIKEAKWDVLVLNRTHPFLLKIYNSNESYQVSIYIWNITHGGIKRPDDEYRIQITGITHFQKKPDTKTLILGWWSELEIFAAWDLNYHKGKLGSSPSLQIRRKCLEDAHLYGFAPCLKDNKEIAIAFRPDMLIAYITNMEHLHQLGKFPKDRELLLSVIKNPYTINENDLELIPLERRTKIASIQIHLRSSSFRSRILTAYRYRCAFCGIQLGLVQAAHILPVNAQGSTDETSNGIAACYLHHAAYDRGLITFDKDYRVYINKTKINQLKEMNRIGGKNDFEKSIKTMILLPPDKKDRPHIKYIQEANHIRGWTKNDYLSLR